MEPSHPMPDRARELDAMECSRSIVPERTLDSDPETVRAPALPVWSVSVEVASEGGPPVAAPPQGDVPAFVLLRCIGTGGMGEVWEAVQGSLSRVVAVKRLRRRPGESDNATTAAAKREAFRQEARVAAALEHPNIVPVHDLGQDADGGPLLAMKRISGKPWSELLTGDFDALPVDEFLARHLPILMAMAQAVAFAHSRGIVHRDLKPSQMLIGEYGEALLTDWGLAIRWREVDEPGSESVRLSIGMPTPATASNPAGTPALMAPEQTRADCSGIGPWTDVYLLGGTLYFLLCGRFPFESQSAALSIARASVAQVRRPSELANGRPVPPELEELCLHAMRRDPGERVASAEEFRSRLLAYERGTARRAKSREIVEATRARLSSTTLGFADLARLGAEIDEARALWPGNPEADALRREVLERGARQALASGDLTVAQYQADALGDSPRAAQLRGEVALSMRRVARRRTLLRASLGALVAMLVVIAGGSLAFLRVIRTEQQATERERDRALAAEHEAQRRATEAERNLAIASAQGKGAHQLVDFVLRDLKTALDEELVRVSASTEEEARNTAFAIAGRVAAPVLAYYRGLDDRGWPMELRLENADRRHSAAQRFYALGRYRDAIELTTPTLALREAALGPGDPATRSALLTIVYAKRDAGDYPDALADARRLERMVIETQGPDAPELADVYEAMASVLGMQDLADEAIRLARRAVSIRRARMPDRDEALAESLAVLGNLLSMKGAYREARDIHTQVLETRTRLFGPDSDAVASALTNLADVLTHLGERDPALACYQRSAEIWERLLGPDHVRVAGALNNIAIIHEQNGDFAKARVLYERALAGFIESLGPENPHVATCLNNLGVVQTALGDPEAALASHRRALAIREATLGNNHTDTASSHHNISKALQKLGRLDEAHHHASIALEICERVFGPVHPLVANCLQQLASLETDRGNAAEAVRLLERGVVIREAVFGPHHPAVAELLVDLAIEQSSTGDLESAEASSSRALAICVELTGPESNYSVYCRFVHLQVLASLFTFHAGNPGTNDQMRPTAERMVNTAEGGPLADIAASPDTYLDLAEAYWLTGRHECSADVVRRLKEFGFPGPDAQPGFVNRFLELDKALQAGMGESPAGS